MNNSNIGYIVMPIGLTIEQREVYTYLYEKCNFQDMTVEYTVSQIVVDSDKRLNLTPMKVRTILKKFLLNGYIVDIHKGSKGNPSTLKIITIKQQLNNNNITNKIAQPSQLQEVSNNNVTTKQQIINNPIKEKEKENIYSENMANAIKRYPGKKIKSVRDRKLPKLIKQYGEEQIIKCIDRYSNECKSKDKQFILQESTFWNGRYEDYLDENYLDKQEPTKTIRREEMKMTFRDL